MPLWTVFSQALPVHEPSAQPLPPTRGVNKVGKRVRWSAHFCFVNGCWWIWRLLMCRADMVLLKLSENHLKSENPHKVRRLISEPKGAGGEQLHGSYLVYVCILFVISEQTEAHRRGTYAVDKADIMKYSFHSWHVSLLKWNKNWQQKRFFLFVEMFLKRDMENVWILFGFCDLFMLIQNFALFTFLYIILKS